MNSKQHKIAETFNWFQVESYNQTIHILTGDTHKATEVLENENKDMSLGIT